MITLRLRRMLPIPHEVEQPDQPLNDDTTQCTAHPCSLQLRTARKYGQSAPPWTATFVTERVRCCAPEPHDLVHVVQAFHSETSQSAAHGAALQLRVSSRYGHT